MHFFANFQKNSKFLKFFRNPKNFEFQNFSLLFSRSAGGAPIWVRPPRPGSRARARRLCARARIRVRVRVCSRTRERSRESSYTRRAHRHAPASHAPVRIMRSCIMRAPAPIMRVIIYAYTYAYTHAYAYAYACVYARAHRRHARARDRARGGAPVWARPRAYAYA
jgi:hypothetical protein